MLHKNNGIGRATTRQIGIEAAKIGADRFKETVGENLCNGSANYSGTGTTTKYIPALMVESVTETFVTTEQVGDDKFTACRDEDQSYTLRGKISSELNECGHKCGTADSCIFDEGSATGQTVACGDNY